VGANALVVAGLVHRRLKTGDGRFDALARRLGRFLVTQTRADGSVLEYWSPVTGRPVPGVFGIFLTGEAFYALVAARLGGGHHPERRVRTRAGVFATTPAALASDDTQACAPGQRRYRIQPEESSPPAPNGRFELHMMP
jgi:hypothetical protein